ncbi:MAG: crotonase/enoyl-CoA hydratase family protein [Myxococcota bacterium]|nr:crotonase/enoyl-CoA hydratase family protein [Myxococcota bacterium]
MAEEPVQYGLDGAVAVIRMDDGKANALSHTMLDALHGALDRAQEDSAGAVALIGRPGRFSAGFDLSVMGQGPDAVRALVGKGAGLALRIFEWPAPVVLGVTGHALAMGAVLCMAADERIGSEGAYKVGLNEVAIKMTLPGFALVLAEDRLSRRHLGRATAGAEIYDPAGAVDAGYFDRVVGDGEADAAACARAAELAATLHGPSHAATKRAVRRESAERLTAAVGLFSAA